MVPPVVAAALVEIWSPMTSWPSVAARHAAPSSVSACRRV
jgi:hypothetical protein